MIYDNGFSNSKVEFDYSPLLNKEKKLRILGKKFINNNKDKCKIIYKNKEYELKEFFEDIDKNHNNKDLIILELKFNNDITNISYMFSYCKSIIVISNLSKINISKITNINHLFAGCSSLISLPDISKWDTSNIINISCMFQGCKSLISLPDISQWNLHKVTNITSMFYECKSLISLPDISKWNISNIDNISKLFCY